jgi:thymidylate synthase
MKVSDIRDVFIQKYKDQEFIVSRAGDKTIEILGASFVADEDHIFGEPNKEYIEAELSWYDSQSTNINDIYQDKKEPPKAWQMTANKHGEINSNYGYLINSDKYFDQFGNALTELWNNPNSRRATIVYTRPSIWLEYNEQGKNDFICTNAVTYYIRDNKLHCVVQMRSNDVVFGYRNDYAWQLYVLNSMCLELSAIHQYIDIGDIHWQVQNLHIYERHFHLIEG